jgi:hypothetical protein
MKECSVCLVLQQRGVSLSAFLILQQHAIKNHNEICEAAKNTTFASFVRSGEEDLVKLCS